MCPVPDSGVAVVSEPEAGPDAAMTVDATQTEEAALAPEGIIDLDSGVGGLCSVDDAAASGTAEDSGSPVDPDAEAGLTLDAEAAVSCGCTRRPGAGNTSQCPAGLGEYGSATIGPSGGSVQVQGRQGVASGVAAQLAFPPTAIATPTDIKLIETAIPPPQDVLDWSPVYLAEPAGLTLAERTPIQLPWGSGPFPVTQSPLVVTAAGLSILVLGRWHMLHATGGFLHERGIRAGIRHAARLLHRRRTSDRGVVDVPLSTNDSAPGSVENAATRRWAVFLS